MEGFTQILGSLGKVIGGGASALSPVMSLMGMINQYSLAGKEKAAMDRATYFSKHPEAINSMVSQFQKPLETGLVKGTENIVNASLAEQGLSQAPGIQTQVLSQALAPYQQNEQQMAITEAFKALGLPIEALSAIQSTMRPNDLAAMLKGILPGGQQPATPTGPLPSDAGGWGDVGSSTGGITATPGIFSGDTSSLGAL